MLTAALRDRRTVASTRAPAAPLARASSLAERSLPDELDKTTGELIVRRARLGLGLVVLSIAVFALGDLGADPSRRSMLFAIKLIQLGFIACLFYALDRPRAAERALTIALLGVTGIAVTTAASGFVSQDEVAAPLLLLILTMGASALIPWGARVQLCCALISGAAAFCSVSQGSGLELALGRPGIAFLVAFAASVCTAFELRRTWTALVQRNLQLGHEKELSITVVAEQRRASEALRESEERYRSVAETAPDAIITADSGGRIVTVNAAGQRLFGYVAEELIGQPVTRLMPERFHDAYQCGLDRFVKTGQASAIGRVLELTARCKEGGEFPVELSLSVWKTSHGTFFTGILRDITEKKNLERMRRDMLAMLSHDLKNPLTAILGFAEILHDAPGDDPQREEFLARIAANARTAVNLALNFVDASHIDSGTIDPKLEPISLNAVAASVLGHQESGARVKGIRLELRVDDSIPQASLDRRMIDRVVANLVTNAIKFSPARSHVLVETLHRDGSVGLRVQDQGPGIPAEQRPRLFERYSQFGARPPDSSGLGLFIVKTLVDAQGGRVHVDFPAGAGSVFEIWFPAEHDGSRNGN